MLCYKFWTLGTLNLGTIVFRNLDFRFLPCFLYICGFRHLNVLYSFVRCVLCIQCGSSGTWVLYPSYCLTWEIAYRCTRWKTNKWFMMLMQQNMFFLTITGWESTQRKARLQNLLWHFQVSVCLSIIHIKYTWKAYSQLACVYYIFTAYFTAMTCIKYWDKYWHWNTFMLVVTIENQVARRVLSVMPCHWTITLMWI